MCVSFIQPVLPAVLSAIGESQTRSIVDTWCDVIHTLQSCKWEDTVSGEEIYKIISQNLNSRYNTVVFSRTNTNIKTVPSFYIHHGPDNLLSWNPTGISMISWEFAKCQLHLTVFNSTTEPGLMLWCFSLPIMIFYVEVWAFQLKSIVA